MGGAEEGHGEGEAVRGGAEEEERGGRHDWWTDEEITWKWLLAVCVCMEVCGEERFWEFCWNVVADTQKWIRANTDRPTQFDPSVCKNGRPDMDKSCGSNGRKVWRSDTRF